MSKQIIRCLDCEFCEGYRKLGNTRREFFCKHLDQKYIHDYFEEHRMKSMAGFLGFGKMEVPLKASPVWCPRKKKVRGEAIG